MTNLRHSVQTARTTGSLVRITITMRIPAAVSIWSDLSHPDSYPLGDIGQSFYPRRMCSRLAPVPSDSTALPVSDLTP